jgi:hypothetical protein
MSMMRTWMKVFWVVILIPVVIGCSVPGMDASTPEALLTEAAQATMLAATSSPLPTETATATLPPTVPPPTEIPATSTPVPTPTEDTRPLPEQWMSWPVVPSMSEAMKALYKQGLAMGNDPRHFSKIGDCQNIPDAFLGMYDDPTRYTLSERYSYLQETIDNFAGSFSRYGYSMSGGFVFPTIFSPLRADPDVCLAGETPLECEFRVHRPMFVFIAMEYWYEGRTVENYESYLRQTVEFALSKGTVPILGTKADNVEGNHSINKATARVAYEYDVPLWNWWLAAQSMPYQGIDPKRGTFHISFDAWLVRSFTALRTLDALWREGQAYVSAP